MERDQFTYRVTSSDPDGNVVKYESRQISGTKVELTGDLSFMAPEVIQDEKLIFEVTATDNSGNSTSKTVEVLIHAYADIADIEFEDIKLQECFELALDENVIESELDNIDPLISRWVDAGDIYKLDCMGYEVGDISGLSILPNLTSLYLGHDENLSDLNDISELELLTKLTSLFLYNNNVTDISALVSLKNINTLHLKGIYPNNLSLISELEERVRKANFARVHRSHLVNLRHASTLRRNGEQGVLELDGDTPYQVPVSRTNLKTLKVALGV